MSKTKAHDPNFRVTNNNAIDIHVGRRVRQRRTLLGMSQEGVAEHLDITFQQIQKYERGANRISASRLWDIAQILDVPVSYFFDDMDEATAAASPRKVSGGNVVEFKEPEKDPLARRETLELVRAYYGITDTAVRKRITEMVKSVSGALGGKVEISGDLTIDVTAPALKTG